MGIFFNLVVFFFALAILAISGGYSTNAAVRVTHIDDWRENEKLKSAHTKLSWAAVITWITVAAILVAGILFLFFGSEEAVPESIEASKTGGPNLMNWFVNGLIFLSLLAIIFVGILSAFAAGEIDDSGVPDKDLANRQAIIGTVLAIVGGILLIVVLAINFFYKPKKKSDPEIKRLETELGEKNITATSEDGGDAEWVLEELQTNPDLANL